MRVVRVVHGGSGVPLGSKIAVAESWLLRLRGLLGRAPLSPGEGLLLLRCASVHTVGMRYAIDVAFLDCDGRVVRSIAALEPFRVGVGGPEAVHTLELPAGRLDETETVPGVRLSWS